MHELMLQDTDMLEKLSRYEQRMFSTMLRCTRELRTLQKEEIEEVQDDVAHDDADGFTGSDPNGGAPDDAQSNVQNEPTAAPVALNPNTDQHFQSPLSKAVNATADRIIADLQRKLDAVNGLTSKSVA